MERIDGANTAPRVLCKPIYSRYSNGVHQKDIAASDETGHVLTRTVCGVIAERKRAEMDILSSTLRLVFLGPPSVGKKALVRKLLPKFPLISYQANHGMFLYFISLDGESRHHERCRPADHQFYRSERRQKGTPYSYFA